MNEDARFLNRVYLEVWLHDRRKGAWRMEESDHLTYRRLQSRARMVKGKYTVVYVMPHRNEIEMEITQEQAVDLAVAYMLGDYHRININLME